jgi:heparan-alpha-glucosaminide N-acetyltransferase
MSSVPLLPVINATDHSSPSSPSSAAQDHQAKKKPQRLVSLDTLRGIFLFIMIVANYSDNSFKAFEHSAWNGLTIADIVFPGFLFSMGTAMSISFGSSKSLDHPWETMRDVAVRSAKLWAICLFQAIFPEFDLPHWRIPGVLFRFAWSYLIVSAIILFVPERRVAQGSRLAFLQQYLHQIVAVLSLLLLYVAIMFGVDVPGCGRGYLGAGGTMSGPELASCTGGAARLVDMKLFTLNHMYRHPTCTRDYKCVEFDPEGAVGILTSCCTVFLGLMAGRLLRHHQGTRERMTRLLVTSAVLLLLGIALCGASRNDGPIPINKNLWSPSFVAVNGAIGYFGLALCLYVVDIRKWWSGYPLKCLGMNAILFYVYHELAQDFFGDVFSNTVDRHISRFLFSVTGACFWLWVSTVLYRNNYFFKL